ncbi:alpha/beta fold hydrolase [Pseudomonas sp.]|uniref:alpha/beta fold hydrolase n=1 Tax=Pseudomonas sp. TaxID=306 RepID=UPI0027296E1F|nr:alpha/beta fold hydrolase [Pseudomonas sp.]
MTNVTLLPGWAMGAATLEPLRTALSESLPHSTVQIRELPSIQLSTIEDDLEALAVGLPAGVLVGWSLGGAVALQLLRRFPERFQSIVCIASNPSFVARADWPGMAPETFKSFYADFRDEPERTLKRFGSLVAQGSEQARQLRRALTWDQAEHEQRLHALAVLGVLDGRAALRQAPTGVLYCLGGQDALVPAEVGPALEQTQDRVSVAIHAQASHALPLEQPLWLAHQIQSFLAVLQLGGRGD